MPRRSKAEAQTRHARRRFRERCAVAVSAGDLRRLVADIQAGRLKFVERQSTRVTVFAADIDGEAMHVVYDRKHKTIVTVLYPPEVLRERMAKIKE